MEQITLLAHGKINLSLDITGTRADGYHLMDMLMQSVSLSDTVTVRKAADFSVTLSGSDAPIPLDMKNTAYKAASLFFAHTGLSGGAAITLKKEIPSEAGMAGGSADAAAVLIGLNILYEARLSTETLCSIGVKVGADVPFCIVGGTARVSGIGEKIEPLPHFCCENIVIVKPPFGISTPASFKRFDSLTSPLRPDNERLLDALAASDYKAIARYTANVLEEAADSPEIAAIKSALLAAGADCALMTGSGSAVFGLFSDGSTAAAAREALAPFGKVHLCRTVDRGVSVV